MYFRYGKTTAVYRRDGCNFTEITKSFGYLSEQWSNLERRKKKKKKRKKHSDTVNWINSAWGYFKALGN